MIILKNNQILTINLKIREGHVKFEMAELDKGNRVKSTQASKYPIQWEVDDVLKCLKTQLLEHNGRSIMTKKY